MINKQPTWTDIRKRATAFSARWANAADERAQSQIFWHEFFGIFGIDSKRVGQFEAHAKRVTTGRGGRIDYFWPRILLVEHKSVGKNLDEAEAQALDYLDSISQSELPNVIITSDFTNIRLLFLRSNGDSVTIKTADLSREIERFGFILGQKKASFENEEEANVQAARLMGKLYEELSKDGYDGHDASILLTRLLFLLFGDDTGMWQRSLFADFIIERTNSDGADLGPQMSLLFQELDKPEEKRSEALDDYLKRFPYVNGGLFKERLDIPTFDRGMRDQLLEACSFDWSKISPALFGSMFQTIKSKDARRELGEHYTPEKFILRVIEPLFLDDLREQVENAKDSAQKLKNIRERLKKQNYLDPACGCGNFLIVAYKYLRRIELEILKHLDKLNNGFTQQTTDVTSGLAVTLDQFSGIEIEEWPARIAEVAMFLADHQANIELGQVFGEVPDRLPITNSANIRIGNALQVDWTKICKVDNHTYIFGNPPFVGSALQSIEQKKDTEHVWGDTKGSLNLDYVAAWYLVAAKYIEKSEGRAGFVSTNSITQGEQPAIIWSRLSSLGIRILFAHRTFSWASEAPGKAAVHCVIVAFSRFNPRGNRYIWDYADVKGEGACRKAKNINAYLIDAPDVLVTSSSRPLSPGIPPILKGSQPTDDGFLSDIDENMAKEIKKEDPIAAKYLRRLIGARELIHNEVRYCLWLVGAETSELRESVELRKRVKAVRDFRLLSKSAGTRKDADRPAEFQSIRQPKTDYLAVPRHSSEDRDYVPIAWFGHEVIANDALSIIENASTALFGVLSSKPFNIWNKAISGRLESRTRITNTITYNNFPFPEDLKNNDQLSDAAKSVLDVRKTYSENSLADLYDPLAMPKDLVTAHRRLDRCVLEAYGLSGDATEIEILAELFNRYSRLKVN